MPLPIRSEHPVRHDLASFREQPCIGSCDGGLLLSASCALSYLYPLSAAADGPLADSPSTSICKLAAVAMSTETLRLPCQRERQLSPAWISARHELLYIFHRQCSRRWSSGVLSEKLLQAGGRRDVNSTLRSSCQRERQLPPAHLSLPTWGCPPPLLRYPLGGSALLPFCLLLRQTAGKL